MSSEKNAQQMSSVSVDPPVYLCIDSSGSTRNSIKYWAYVSGIVESNPSAIIIFWATSARKATLDDARHFIESRLGDFGTSPQCFIPLLPPSSHPKINLVIVTDGQIYGDAVKECDALLEGREFSHVDVHFFSTNPSETMNLSVSASFTRNTQYRIYVDGKLLTDGSSQEVIALKKYYGEPDLFIAESEELLKQIAIQNLGKNNSTLRDKLLGLQKDLVSCIARKNAQANETAYTELRQQLKDDNLSNAIAQLKSIISVADSTKAKRVEAIIQALIRHCSGTYDFSFDILMPGRLARATQIQQPQTEELAPVEVAYEGGFECPVMLSADLPCMMITQGEPVLEGLEKGYVNSLINNPFLLLNDPDLVEKVKRRLDTSIGLGALKELFSRGEVKSPMTRNRIECALTFGHDPTHVRATNFALASLLFGRKLVGLSELWLAMLYFIVRQITRFVENGPSMEAFKSHLIYRMETTLTNMTLSGLPFEPLMKCPVDIAVWYCVMSPHLMDLNNSQADDARNRLRSFGSSAVHLLDLVDLLGYPYDRTWTLRQLARYKAFAWFMLEEKKGNNSQWRNMLRSQHQGSLVLEEEEDGTLVMLDGPPTEPVTLPNFKVGDGEELPLGELLRLAELVDPSKSINAVIVPNELTPREIPETVVNYGYPIGRIYTPEELQMVQICPKTMRPYVVDPAKRVHWVKCAEDLFGCPLSEQLSVKNYFVKFVMEHGKFPRGKQEFIKYMAAKQLNREERVDTLPRQCQAFADAVFDSYETVLGPGFSALTPHEFKRRVYASLKEEKRAELDGSKLVANNK